MNVTRIPIALVLVRRLLIRCGIHYYIPELRKFAPREKLLQRCGHCDKVFLTLDVKEHFRDCPVLNAQLMLGIVVPPRPFHPYARIARINHSSELENAS
jgi:hypothetical protein